VDLGLQDSVIVVTGGGAGIGEAVTRACLNEGAAAVVVGRASDNVKSFMLTMEREQRRCDFFEAQLGDAEQCRRAVEFVQEKHGRLDGLVNNAGANDGVGLESGDPERFMESLRQNLLHYYAMAHYALPMLKTAQGAIVNISSKVALTGQGAAELLPFNIRVNSVLPAEVLTPLYEKWLSTREDPAAALKSITTKIPLGRRMTEAAEIAAMTVFLLSSKQSGHTTAQQMVVDGGYTHLDRALT
jgi:L-fucose dehydrogenase